MLAEQDQEVFVYVGIWKGLRVAVIVDGPEHKRDTAKELSRWIRDDYTVVREPLAEFRRKGLARCAEIERMKDETPTSQQALPL